MLELPPTTDSELKEELTSLLRSLEEKRKRPVVCFHQGRGREGKYNAFDDATCTKMVSLLEVLGSQEKLSVIIESPGGDIDCAFRIVRVLRHYAKNVEVLVPRYAKSAATFFCLAADAIYMGRDAELGPLDTQVHDPRGSVLPRSALNAFKSLEYLRQYLLETLDQVVMTLMINGGMDIPFAVEAARPLVADIVTPLYQRVNPYDLGEARRNLSIGEEYSKIVMRRYSYRERIEQDIEKIVSTLVWGYPSHSFVIDVTEAQRIGLKAKLLDQESTELCMKLVTKVDYCYGFASDSSKSSPGPVRKLKEKTHGEGIQSVPINKGAEDDNPRT